MMFRLFAKALGEKSGKTTTESDKIAVIRMALIGSYILTNITIICGVIRHW